MFIYTSVCYQKLVVWVGFFLSLNGKKNFIIQTKLICSILLKGKGTVRTARAHDIF